MADDKPTAAQADEITEEVAERLTRRQILGLRFAASLQSRILAMLEALEAELVERLVAFDAGSNPARAGRNRRLAALLDETRDEIRRAYERINAYSQAELTGLLEAEVDAVRSLLSQSAAVVNITLGVGLPTATTMAALTREALVLGLPLKTWWARQEQATIDAFAREMRLSVMAGEPVGDMIRRIRGGRRDGVMLRGVMDVSKAHAETLVRTSVASVQNTARQAVYEANLDVIEAFAHLSRLDSRTSDICIARSGKRWDARTRKPIGHALPFQAPPLHPRCRSVLTPVVIGGRPPSDRSADEWIRGLSTEEQDDLLGKGRADLFRAGRISSRDLIDQANRPLTLQELRARSS